MPTPMQQLRDAIYANHPASQLMPMSAPEISRLAVEHPNMPADLRNLFATVGCGSIGQSRYMVHALLSPDNVYDDETAKSLLGILLVGDDFAGTCEAYDTRGRTWLFGNIGSDCEFRVSSEWAGFVEFLTEWYGVPAAP